MLASANQMSVAYGMVCQVLSWKVAIYTLCVCGWTVSKRKWQGRKVIMKVLSGSVLYCKRDQSNFEVGKRNIPKSTAPVIYKHNRDRELLAGASAKGRSKATSDLSVHTHTNRHRRTLILSQLS